MQVTVKTVVYMNSTKAKTDKTPRKSAKDNVPGNVSNFPLSPQKQIECCIQDLNRRYYHLVISGKNRIMRMVPRAIGTGKEAEFFTLDEFRLLWLHDEPVCVGFKYNGEVPKFETKGNVWLKHRDANFLDGGLEFDPSHPPLSVTPKGKFNIWQGFGVEPEKCQSDDTQVGMYLDHIREVICSGVEEHYHYLVQYLSHWVQKPWEKPSVAVVLKAGQGTGKGTFMDALLTIAGGHGLSSTNKNDVVGRFNAALEARSLVFFDEAFAGSKEASDMLKGLISENYTRLERKGIDGCFVQNRMRVFMASNHENIVQIETDDRRYLFLRVSDKHKQDKDYFGARSFMRHSHPEHEAFAARLLDYLLRVSIKNFDPYHAPVTDELTSQKIDCLPPAQKWVYNMLLNGCMVEAGGWPSRVSSLECQAACESWLDTRRMKLGHGDPAKTIGTALNMAGIKSKMMRLCGDLRRGREFPDLDKARENFCKAIKGDIDWTR